MADLSQYNHGRSWPIDGPRDGKGKCVSIKTFIFDCGGVVLRRADAGVYDGWATRLGMTVQAFSDALWSGSPWVDAQVGRITEHEYWQRAGAKLGIEDADEVARLQQELWEDWALDQDVVAIIDGIRERFPVAMLSNASDVLEHKLKHQYGIADRFGSIFNSARLGLAKPDPAIYTTVLQQLDVQPQEVVFIDDRADNVTAAASLGIHVIWYVNACELRRQLGVYLKNGTPMLQPAAEPAAEATAES